MPSAVPPTSTPQAEATTPPPPSSLTINVSAANIAFDRAAISVPVETQITVVFTNTDTGVLHDFGVSIPAVEHSETCTGPCSDSITFNSGSAGRYSFQCSIHPDPSWRFSSP